MKNKNDALEKVLHVLEISSNDTMNINIIDNYLTSSVGVKDSENFYRPNYVIGLMLWLDTTNNVIKAEGATLDQNFETTRRYLNVQQIEDVGVTIPQQYTCDELLKKVQVAEPSGENVAPRNIGFLSF